ncbi:MAG TPA: DUF3160 domain-containing protein [Spirochaetota bacterium]|nr:DUF3160 domain-containing protein [Spirochaetota bacterium]HPI88811.1 DUF3160 domain-containing protein [Spirochaetota bacterium]HPR47701.1 DUF3160 domain-containing protein [Spirochaetota bacterium]
MQKIIVACLVIALPFSSISCKKKSEIWTSAYVDVTTVLGRLGQPKIGLPEKTIKKPVYTISGTYLKDTVNFKTLPRDKWHTEEIAVVGKEGVKLYQSVEAAVEICDIPKGTLIPLIKEITKPGAKNTDEYDDECLAYYQFNGETNYWYQTEYNGKKGYVFGSYLVFGSDTEDWGSVFSKIAIQNDEFLVKYKDSYTDKLKKLSYYYTKPVKSDAFHDFNGRVSLSRAVSESLKKNRIAVEKVSFEEYKDFLRVSDYGSLDFPDDMITLYAMQHNDMMTTTFITVDLLVHSLHLVFDRMLQDTEENRLLPLLRELTGAYYAELSRIQKEKTKSSELMRSVDLMIKYFLVAGDLLGMDLTDRGTYPEDVSGELVQINQAAGISESSLFHYKEDYSQFVPRGHYAKNENLKKYFKAMMWFGRLHFYCVQNHPDKLVNENSIKLTRAALLLAKIAKENDTILALWHSLYDPITYIVGESDDYNLDQYLAASGDVDFGDFGRWIDNKNNITGFIAKIDKQLSGPGISGNKLDQHQGSFSPETPRGFRFFGQRFTLDGFIFTMLSSPRVGDPRKARTMVKGLDVMAVLGSKTAAGLIKDDMKEYANFETNYTMLKDTVENLKDDYWRNTFYRSYLRVVKEIANFDSGMPFYFTQTSMWDNKSLITSHAAWAELRHDTILYAKQSAAEKAGPGPCKTWDVDYLNRPIGYLEPNLGALYWIQSILEDSITVLSKNEFMSEYFANKFQDFRDLMGRAVEIAEVEAQDKVITDEQNEYLYQMPARLARIVMPPDGNIIEQDLLKMAIIADVHTDADNGTVLEVGTGIPYRIHVALNDGNGGKRIATGFMLSYYEFEQPMNDRLTDEKWKDMVYNDQDSIEKYRPEWAKEVLTR